MSNVKQVLCISICTIIIIVIMSMPFHKFESIDNSLYDKFENGFLIGSNNSIPNAEEYCRELFNKVKTWEVAYLLISDRVHYTTLIWMEDLLFDHIEKEIKK